MFEFIATLLVAMAIMIALMAVGVALTMPFHGALVRLRANYNPRAVGLEGTENRSAADLYSGQTSGSRTDAMQSRPYTDDAAGDSETDEESGGLVWAVQG